MTLIRIFEITVNEIWADRWLYSWKSEIQSIESEQLDDLKRKMLNKSQKTGKEDDCNQENSEYSQPG